MSEHDEDAARGKEVFDLISLDLMCPGLHARICRGVASGGLDLGKVSEPV